MEPSPFGRGQGEGDRWQTKFVSRPYLYNKMLEVAEDKLNMLKEDAMKMRAKDLHELLRAWENYHRILTAEAHMKHIQFREESRYPGFYYRTDKNFVD